MLFFLIFYLGFFTCTMKGKTGISSRVPSHNKLVPKPRSRVARICSQWPWRQRSPNLRLRSGKNNFSLWPERMWSLDPTWLTNSIGHVKRNQLWRLIKIGEKINLKAINTIRHCFGEPYFLQGPKIRAWY